MTAAREERQAALRNLVDLDLAEFAGLVPGTTRGEVSDVLGPAVAEGFAGGAFPLWMTVHDISPGIRATAWYLLDEEALEPVVGQDQSVLWIDRPIRPEDVQSLRDRDDGYSPPRRDHLVAWPERGMCLRMSRRSRLPTLLLAFAAMDADEFERSPISRHD
jgi:hypothetical protein